MGQLDNQRIEKRDAKKGSDPTAQKWLQTLSQPNVSGNAFYCEGLRSSSVLGLLQAAANASAFVSFGFNRSGGMNIMVMLEGGKQPLRVQTLDDADVALANITVMLNAYAAEKGWLPPTG